MAKNQRRKATAIEVAGAGVLDERGYARLRKDLRVLLEAGRAAAEAAVGHILATTYWRVGRRILDERLTQRAAYGDGTVQDLARDLELPLRTLQHALRFARLYDAPPAPGLTWTHYRELLGLTDDDARAFYEEQARAEGWSVRRLTAEIAQDAYTAAHAPKKREGPRLPRPADANYVYRCEVDRVIDGDTLMVLIDLGFDVVRRQRLRLVHVDAAEEETTLGQEATRFVRGRLAQARTVVVKTARSSDARGRYLAHVFYSVTDADADTVLREGEYLNAELLREGVATLAFDPTAA